MKEERCRVRMERCWLEELQDDVGEVQGGEGAGQG